MSLRFSQTRSPRTALDAQLFVDKGGLKILGLSHSQRIESEIGINTHLANHLRDQIEAISSGRAAYRVQTLQGLL
jgi:hypothetical protein